MWWVSRIVLAGPWNGFRASGVSEIGRVIRSHICSMCRSVHRSFAFAYAHQSPVPAYPYFDAMTSRRICALHVVDPSCSSSCSQVNL